MNDMPNRAARRAKGYRKQVKAVRLDVPAERAAAKGVKHGDRFVIPQRRLNREGKLEVCQTGQETIFLANVVQPPEGAADENPERTPSQPG